METSKTLARRAGLYYLGLVVFGVFGLMYMPSQIIVKGDAAVTALNIVNHPVLFRAGIVSGLICQVYYMLTVLALYNLLKHVDKSQAKLMVAFVLVAVPIAFLNVVNLYAMATYAEGTAYLDVFSKAQLQAQVLFFENLYQDGVLVAQIFWGLWLIPLGYLAFKSGMFPKVLGIWLILDGCVFLLDFLVANFFPGFRETLGQFTMIFSLAEFAFVIYLLLKGVKSNAPKLTHGLSV